MKALIRREGETVLESDGIEGIDWNTGAPLTNPEWCGGPYEIVDNFTEPTDGDGHFAAVRDCANPSAASPPADVPAEIPTEDPADGNLQDTVVIDGVTYTRRRRSRRWAQCRHRLHERPRERALMKPFSGRLTRFYFI